MRYIDKTRFKQKGEQIISEFLACFYRRKGAYPDDMFYAFSTEIDDAHNHIKFRNRLIHEVMMVEQNGLCCYCMRKLSDCGKITIEHIMPNHAADKSELDKYRTRTTELDMLPHNNDFRLQSPIVYPPHPHSIAYQNLILSCDGDFFNENSKPACCNLKRMHTFLIPFVLYQNIEQKFLYTYDGWAEWTEDPEPPESNKNAIKILGLNNPILRMVRRIWFFCNENSLDPRRDSKEYIINTMMGCLASPDMTEIDANMLLNFKKDKYWKLLMEYDAFSAIKHHKFH